MKNILQNKIMRKFRDAGILNGKAGTIAHLDCIETIIFFGMKVQIVEVEGEVMSSTGVRVPIEIPGLEWGSSVSCEI
jgi:hypothetical protein